MRILKNSPFSMLKLVSYVHVTKSSKYSLIFNIAHNRSGRGKTFNDGTSHFFFTYSCRTNEIGNWDVGALHLTFHLRLLITTMYPYNGHFRINVDLLVAACYIKPALYWYFDSVLETTVTI